MNDTEIRQQVDAFVNLSRAERREQFPNLPREVKIRARKIIEARRGIAYRTEGGVPVLTQEAYEAQIIRRTAKAEDLNARISASADGVVELKRQLQENYGDDALSDVEVALEEQASDVVADNA